MNPEVEEAWDFILDCYNATKALANHDSSVWEPVKFEGGKIFSLIDGHQLNMEEFLTPHEPGTFKPL